METKDIIDRLGGPSKVASMLGITVAAVSGWRGNIPPLRILQLSDLTGIPVSEFRKGRLAANQSSRGAA